MLFRVVVSVKIDYRRQQQDLMMRFTFSVIGVVNVSEIDLGIS